jgi:uncharacterized membrane protein YraQ (UPF0718 family)
MFLLVTSLLALVVGPLLFRLADRAHWALLALDGFITATVAGLVLVHIVPESVSLAGPWALVLAVAGFLGPGLLEHHLHRAARTTHVATLVLACVGLLAHEFFDGVALGMSGPGHAHHDEGSLLAIAVVLHRLPVAVTVWWLLRSSIGPRLAAVTLAGLGLATVAGFAFAGAVAPLMEDAWVGFLQCLVGGSLLHVVIHRPPSLPAPPSTGRGHVHAGLGALLGVLVVGALSDNHLPHQHAHGELSFGDIFMTLALESAPALLLGVLLVGLSKVYLPQASPRWLTTGRASTEALRGAIFGLPLPIGRSAVLPVYRALTGAGVPAAAGLAFLLATPALGLETILISLPLLGVKLTLARVLAAGLLATLIGAWIGRLGSLGRLARNQPGPAAEAARTPEAQAAQGKVMAQVTAIVRSGHAWTRLGMGLRLSVSAIVDDVGPWLLLGLAAAALAEPLLGGSGQWLTQLPAGADVVIFTLLGVPVYLGAAGVTPLATVLIHEGVSPGAALAFLLVGPVTHFAALGAVSALHGRRIALAMAGAFVGLAVALGLLANALLDQRHAVALHDSAHQAPGAVGVACLAVLAVLLALSLLRLGPRGFIGQVLFPHSDEEDAIAGGEHAHAHEHAHGADRS